MSNNDMVLEVPMEVEVLNNTVPMSLGSTINPTVTYAELEDVTASVSAWLEDNVDPATGYLVDKTLRIENAAADSKSVGDALTEKMPIVEFGEKTVLVNTTTVSFSKDGENDWYVSGNNPLTGFIEANYEDNVLYTITWDGTEYECLYFKHYVRINNEGGYISAWRALRCLGNTDEMGYHTPWGMTAPFAIIWNDDTEVINIFAFNSTANTHTVKIEKTPFIKEIIKKPYYESTGAGLSAIEYYDQGVVVGAAAWAEGGGFAVGQGAKVSADYGIAMGLFAESTASGGIAIGPAALASGLYSIAIGQDVVSSGQKSLATGYRSTASGPASYSEGQQTVASGNMAHAEGNYTIASGSTSHAEGRYTTASGGRSHAQGDSTIANHYAQHTMGAFNEADPSTAAATERGNYIEIVGNGTADDARSNARTLDWEGNEWLAGSLSIGSSTLTEDDITVWQEDFKNNVVVYDDGASVGTAKAWRSGHWLGIQIGLSLNDVTSPTLPPDDSSFKHICYVKKSENTKLYSALEKCITVGTQSNIATPIGNGITNTTNHAFRTRLTYYPAGSQASISGSDAISFATSYMNTEYSNRTLFIMAFIP